MGDADGDGQVDGVDPCPNDALDDADDDGVCGDVDACPGHPDDADADGDGLPDGCDPCPADAEGDLDGDGLCAAEDLCPDSADNDCEVQLVLGLQVDFFFDELNWSLLDSQGGRVDGGDFGSPSQGYFRRITVQADRTSCLSMRDTARDGGNRGIIFNRRLGQRYASWTYEDSRSGQNICFRPSEDGVPFEAPLEADWLKEGACTVDLLLELGTDPLDVAWGLSDEDDKLVQGVEYGTYSKAGDDRRHSLVLPEGRYVLELFDASGDGWQGGSWKMGKPGEAKAFAEGTLASGEFEEVNLRIECGSAP